MNDYPDSAHPSVPRPASDALISSETKGDAGGEAAAIGASFDRLEPPKLAELETWLIEQLEELEARMADFMTPHSRRRAVCESRRADRR